MALPKVSSSPRGEFLREHLRKSRFYKNLDLEAAGLVEDNLYPDTRLTKKKEKLLVVYTGQDYRYFPSQIFEAPLLKFQDFPSSVLVTLSTDLRIWRRFQ